MLSRILIGICFFVSSLVYAGNISVELQDVNLQDTLRILSKFMQLNLVVSPQVEGRVSLHLHEAPADEAFESLLASQGLSKVSLGKILFIAPHSEFIKRKQDKLTLQESLNKVAPLVTNTWQIQYAKAEDIARLLKDSNSSLLSKRGQIHVDTRTNVLCVQDLPEMLAQLHDVVKRLDVPVQQVLIEARMASIDNDFERELGVNFSVENRRRELKPFLNGEAPLGPRFSLAVASLANGSWLDVTLSALEKNGHGELISSPSLFTANQQTAYIESGEEIPYQETSGSGATSIAFKKAVLKLKVTPQIMPGDKILLHLEVNQDKPSNRVVLGVPSIVTRQISTCVLVTNGKAIVLGGIFYIPV